MEDIGNVFYFKWELEFLYWLQSIRKPVFDLVMKTITFLGHKGWFFILIIIVLLLIPGYRKIGCQAAIALLITFLLCNIALKPYIARVRPCWLNSIVQLIVNVPTDYSFPSGHANASFAVATAIYTRDKKLGIPSLVLATLIAVSRLYLFVHWPTDVLAGSIIGICGGIASFFIVNSIYKKWSK